MRHPAHLQTPHDSGILIGVAPNWAWAILHHPWKGEKVTMESNYLNSLADGGRTRLRWGVRPLQA